MAPAKVLCNLRRDKHCKSTEHGLHISLTRLGYDAKTVRSEFYRYGP